MECGKSMDVNDPMIVLEGLSRSRVKGHGHVSFDCLLGISVVREWAHGQRSLRWRSKVTLVRVMILADALLATSSCSIHSVFTTFKPHTDTSHDLKTPTTTSIWQFSPNHCIALYSLVRHLESCFVCWLQLVDIDDGYLSLMDDAGDTRDDIKNPDNDLGKDIQTKFDDGEALLVC